MTFLAPLFLAGLLGLAIPIIVHLTNRPKSNAYPFPSLMFLQRIPFRTMRRQRIRHWWLLAMRAAVLVLVAAGFARPRLEGLGAGGADDRATIVLLGDRAVSLGEATADKTTLLAALDGAGPGFGATRYAAGIQAARDILEQSELPRREVGVISDLPRAGWRPDEGVRLPAGTAVETGDLAGQEGANGAGAGPLPGRG